MKNFCLMFALLGFAMVTTVVAAELKVGDDAPDFKMVGSDGKTYSLADFKDKQAVVIAWFPRAFTGGCTKECKSMREFGKDIKAYDVAYFTASCDPQQKNADFAKSLDLDYPILCDPETNNAQAFGVVAPGKNAAARKTFYIGKNGKILAIDSAVKTESHGKDIAEKLGALGVAKK
ncbi:MAG: redoxin domain-containing protein [Planctomycetaceae bacterium]|nr:redoxin domain-containing protein [Planctomycetaceae bacterium]